MNKTFLEKMKARLLEERARLERDLEDFSKQDPKNTAVFKVDFPETGGDSEDDNSIEASDLADEISIGAKLQNELRDVAKALASIDKGAYGICKYCKKEIDEKRLLARPTSSTCISCKKTLTQEM
ncbi:MAG TPA: TraR/DksA family transcriptional regulator [Patescibacteria group bacterium]|nr:TraR/DksA family transcriptional regulator [Patescibacteria group bacterium]